MRGEIRWLGRQDYSGLAPLALRASVATLRCSGSPPRTGRTLRFKSRRPSNMFQTACGGLS